MTSTLQRAARSHPRLIPQGAPPAAAFPATLVLAALAFASALAAQKAESAVTLERLLAPPFPSEMVGTASDDRLAWVSNERGVRSILCAEAPSWTPRQVVAGAGGDDGQEISSLVWSPNGKRLAYVHGGPANRAGEIPNPTNRPTAATQTIFVVEAHCGVQTQKRPEPAAKRIADGSSPRFRTDLALLFLQGGKLHEASLADRPSQYVGNSVEPVSIETKELLQARGGIGSLRLSPDRGQLAFVSSRGTHSFIAVYHFAKAKLRFLDPSVDLDMEPTWSPDGSMIAFLRMPTRSEPPQIFAPQRRGTPWSIRVADVSSGKGREVWRAQEGVGSVFRAVVANSQITWTADDYLVFPWEGSGYTHLYAVRAARNADDASPGDLARPLTSGEFEVEYVTPLRDGSGVVLSSNQKDIDRRHLWQVDPAGRLEQLTFGSGIENAPVPLSSGALGYIGASGRVPMQPHVLQTHDTAKAYDAHASKIGQAKMGDTELLAADDAGQPGASRVRRRPSTKLVHSNALAEYPSNQLSEPQQVIFPATDGVPIHGQLFVPPGAKPEEKRPALLFLHGGSRRHMMLGFHYSSYYHNTYTFNQYMASRGWVVLSVNYRSGIGYGMEFREALDYGATGASELRDVQGAALFLRTRSDVDPERIALYGGSYGGYLTALGLARSSDLFAAGVDIHGVHDWNRTIQNFVPSYDPLERPEEARLAFESSPMAHVEDWRSPVLLIHGDDDRNVPFAETTELVEKLREVGTEFELLVFPDEVHGFLRHATWLELFERSAEFLERKLAK